MLRLEKISVPLFAKVLDFGPEPDTISLLMRWGHKVDETQVEMCERIARELYQIHRIYAVYEHFYFACAVV